MELGSLSEQMRAAVAGAGSTDLIVVSHAATPAHLDLQYLANSLIVAASEIKSP